MLSMLLYYVILWSVLVAMVLNTLTLLQALAIDIVLLPYMSWDTDCYHWLILYMQVTEH